jgi:hypothetical protein
MDQINVATVSMQTSLMKLSECRETLDLLIEEIEAGKGNPESDFHRCKLGKIYIGAGCDKLPDPDFISGVCKIQNGNIGDMADDEKEACSHLRANVGEEEEAAATLTFQEKLTKMRNKKRSSACLDAQFENVDYIIGSAAEVERVWSVARYVLTTQWMGLTPLMFEALMFLKMNERFWDQSMVVEAMGMARTERTAKAVAEDEDLAEQENECSDRWRKYTDLDPSAVLGRTLGILNKAPALGRDPH